MNEMQVIPVHMHCNMEMYEAVKVQSHELSVSGLNGWVSCHLYVLAPLQCVITG